MSRRLGMRSSRETSGLISRKGGEVEVGVAFGDVEFGGGDGVAFVAVAGLGDGVAAGGVARGAPVVGGEFAEDAVELDRPGDGVQVVREGAGAALLGRLPLALGVHGGRGALLGEFEAEAGEAVDGREAAVGAGAFADADAGAGDQAVLVELAEAVADGLGVFAGRDGAADQGGQQQAGAVEQREDRVVGVVEPGAALGGWLVFERLDLVDAVDEGELAQASGAGSDGWSLSSARAGRPTTRSTGLSRPAAWVLRRSVGRGAPAAAPLTARASSGHGGLGAGPSSWTDVASAAGAACAVAASALVCVGGRRGGSTFPVVARSRRA